MYHYGEVLQREQAFRILASQIGDFAYRLTELAKALLNHMLFLLL